MLFKKFNNQIRDLFLWFIYESDRIWHDFDYLLYVASSEEESKRLTQQVTEKRVELMKEAINSFENKKYINLVEKLLDIWDKDMERARSFSMYPNYLIRSKKHILIVIAP